MARRHADREGCTQENSDPFVPRLPTQPTRPLLTAYTPVGQELQQGEGQVADVNTALFFW